MTRDEWARFFALQDKVERLTKELANRPRVKIEYRSFQWAIANKSTFNGATFHGTPMTIVIENDHLIITVVSREHSTTYERKS